MGQCLSSPRADQQRAKASPAKAAQSSLKPAVKDRQNAAGAVKNPSNAKHGTTGQLPEPVAAGTIPAGVEQRHAPTNSGVEQYASLVSSPEDSQASDLSDPEEFQTYEEGQWVEGEEPAELSPTAEPISIEDIRVLNSAPSHSEGQGVVPIRRSKAGSLTADHPPSGILSHADGQSTATPEHAVAPDDSAAQGYNRQPAEEDQPRKVADEPAESSHLPSHDHQHQNHHQQQQVEEEESYANQHDEQQEEQAQQEQQWEKEANGDQQQQPQAPPVVSHQQPQHSDENNTCTATMREASPVPRKAVTLSVQQPDAPASDRGSRHSSAANSGASSPMGNGAAGSPRPGSASSPTTPRTPGASRSPLPRVATLASKPKAADASSTPASGTKRAASGKGPVSMWAPGKTPPPPSRIPITQTDEDTSGTGITPTFNEQRSRARSTPGGHSPGSKQAHITPASAPRKSSPGGASLGAKAATHTSTATSNSSPKPKAVRMASDKGMMATSTGSGGSTASKLQMSKSLPSKCASPHKVVLTPPVMTGADKVAAEARARRRAKSSAGGALPGAAAKAAHASTLSRAAVPINVTATASAAGGAAATAAGGSVVAASPNGQAQAAVGGDREASVQQAGLPPLEHGRWVLTRTGRKCSCAAKHGTVMMDTLEGQQELFQCSVKLQDGSLAAACLHDGPNGAPKAWLFCPDPLCLASKPEGSQLPDWPWAMPVQAGVELTATEQEELLELGMTPTDQAIEENGGLEAEASNGQ